jgi:uncharacterized membrane protein
MTAAPVVPSELEAYLTAVRDALADLPSAERDDLVAEVEASLLESAGDSTGPIAARLGPPEHFAAELRAAAGLQAVAPAPRRRLPDVVAALRTWAANDQTIASLRRLAFDLAPIWWVVRGYVAVGVLAYAIDAPWSTASPFVPRLGLEGLVAESGGFGLLAILLGVAVSVWRGLHARRTGSRFPRLALAANLALAISCVPVAQELVDRSASNSLASVAFAPVQQPTPGLALDGIPIDNIYPYTRNGRLLHDVLLYDGAGVPIEIVRADDPNRRYVKTVEGTIFNAFPIRYFEPGTTRVARPNAAPPVTIPRVTTPPLEPRVSSRR